MKKYKFLTYGRSDGKDVFLVSEGYIFKNYEYIFGVDLRGIGKDAVWCITDLYTGLMCGKKRTLKEAKIAAENDEIRNMIETFAEKQKQYFADQRKKVEEEYLKTEGDLAKTYWLLYG